MSRLSVALAGSPIGWLVEGERPGEYSFTYVPGHDDAGRPSAALSVSLPRRDEPFRPDECRPFFEGLLPEAGIRDQIARTLGTSPENSFRLFAQLGRDCAGAVTIVPEGAQAPAHMGGAVRRLSDAELVALVDDLPRRPLGVTADMRLSLAGVQRKAVLVRDGSGAFGESRADAPSTHILKPQYADSDFEDVAYNEHFCMRVAECVGLSVARTELLTVGSHDCLVVERFDRSTDGHTTVRRHQEDLCQALGVLPGRKYQEEGGPGFADACGLLRAVSTRGAADVLVLVRTAIVNWLLGNSDAHGKNFALLHGDHGPRLAPLYDLVSTEVYDLKSDFAMAIGEQYRPADLDGGDWYDFASDCGVAYLPFERERERLERRVVHCAEQVAARARAEGWHRPVIDAIVALCRSRAQDVAGAAS